MWESRGTQVNLLVPFLALSPNLSILLSAGATSQQALIQSLLAPLSPSFSCPGVSVSQSSFLFFLFCYLLPWFLSQSPQLGMNWAASLFGSLTPSLPCWNRSCHLLMDGIMSYISLVTFESFVWSAGYRPYKRMSSASHDPTNLPEWSSLWAIFSFIHETIFP